MLFMRSSRSAACSLRSGCTSVRTTERGRSKQSVSTARVQGRAHCQKSTRRKSLFPGNAGPELWSSGGPFRSMCQSTPPMLGLDMNYKLSIHIHLPEAESFKVFTFQDQFHTTHFRANCVLVQLTHSCS